LYIDLNITDDLVNPYILVIGIAIAVIVAGAVSMYFIESPNEDAQIKTMLDAFWWTIATTTTVGYGDIVPVTDLGRTVAIFYMFFGISIAGVFVSIIGTRYYKRKVEPKEDQEIRYEKKILERLDDLEKSLKEIRDSLKK
jgi:voltage-gated potassium channel